MRELNSKDIGEISGSGVSDDVGWAGSLGAAVGFLGFGLAISNPVGAGILVGASIFSSGMAMYYASDS